MDSTDDLTTGNSGARAERPPALPPAVQVDVLLTEYRRLSDEIALHVKGYSPKLSTFMIFLIAALSYAFGNQGYDIVFVVVPMAVFAIGYVTIAQTYIIAAQTIRIREIE